MCRLEGQIRGTDIIVGRRNQRCTISLLLPTLSLDPSMGRDRYAMRPETFHCPRCGVQVREINEPDEGDSAFAARTLRSVPDPADLHLECRWQRTLNNRLLRKWARVAARPSDVPERPNASRHELWLKVVIHLAGFAALLAYLGDHLSLSR
jgi:hypothetical protein